MMTKFRVFVKYAIHTTDNNDSKERHDLVCCIMDKKKHQMSVDSFIQEFLDKNNLNPIKT